MIARPPVETRGARGGVVLSWAAFAAMTVFTSAFVTSSLASSSRSISRAELRRAAAGYLARGALAEATAVLLRSLEKGVEPPTAGTAALGGAPRGDTKDCTVSYTILRAGLPVGAARVRAIPSGPGPGPAVAIFRLEGRAQGQGTDAVARRVVRAIVVPPPRPPRQGPDDARSDPGPRRPAHVEVEDVVSW